MKIHIDVAGGAVTATLDNNESSRDFVKQLPITLTLEDYASTEKISDLPKPLSTQGAPAGFTPSSGDITSTRRGEISPFSTKASSTRVALFSSAGLTLVLSSSHAQARLK